MQDAQEVIYRAATLNQANLLKNLLADEGIEARVTNAALQNAAGDLPYGGPIEPRVVVDSRNAEVARSIALEFEETIARDRAAGSPADVPTSVAMFKSLVRILVYCVAWAILYGFVSDATRNTDFNTPAKSLVFGLFLATSAYLVLRRGWTSEDALEDADDFAAGDDIDADYVPWPRCPSCSRPRHTACPVCQTAGSDFLPAFDPLGPGTDDEDQQHSLVICPTCDEPFRPVYLKRCEWCGHRFADGRDLPPAPLLTSPFAEMNGRAWIVLVGVLLTIGALVGLLGWIASQV